MGGGGTSNKHVARLAVRTALFGSLIIEFILYLLGIFD